MQMPLAMKQHTFWTPLGGHKIHLYSYHGHDAFERKKCFNGLVQKFLLPHPAIIDPFKCAMCTEGLEYTMHYQSINAIFHVTKPIVKEERQKLFKDIV